jgi:hypothetical protein
MTFNYSVQVQVLTCDKLSHCLFDFDCVDLNVYEKEQYNYDYFEIKDMRSTGEEDSENTTHDSNKMTVYLFSCIIQELGT